MHVLSACDQPRQHIYKHSPDSVMKSDSLLVDIPFVLSQMATNRKRQHTSL